MPTPSRLLFITIPFLLFGCASNGTQPVSGTTGSSGPTSKITIDKPATSDNLPVTLSGYADTSSTAQFK